MAQALFTLAFQNLEDSFNRWKTVRMTYPFNEGRAKIGWVGGHKVRLATIEVILKSVRQEKKNALLELALCKT